MGEGTPLGHANYPPLTLVPQASATVLRRWRLLEKEEEIGP